MPRFNMPLELGIFLGAKRYGTGRQKQKITLVLDPSGTVISAFISDSPARISGRMRVIPKRRYRSSETGYEAPPAGATFRAAGSSGNVTSGFFINSALSGGG